MQDSKRLVNDERGWSGYLQVKRATCLDKSGAQVVEDYVVEESDADWDPN